MAARRFPISAPARRDDIARTPLTTTLRATHVGRQGAEPMLAEVRTRSLPRCFT
jgi:hypothetical protein